MASERLPNLVVIGVPKAGTGSLYKYLSQHPDICAADMKEVGYFNYYNPRRHTGPIPPVDNYLAHFRHWGTERYAFEATPTYSYGGQPVIDAMRQVLGAPRIILSLRDPADRLWSAWTFQRELGNLPQFPQFEDYLAACEARSPDGSDLVPRDHLHGLYIGYYANYVPLWLDAFGSDLDVLFADRFIEDPRGGMAAICRWLDIDDTVVDALDLVPRNRTRHPRSTRAAKLVYSTKRAVEHRGRLPRWVRDPVRRAYQRANRGPAPGGMSPDVRRHVEELYRESNARTAEALRRHGYDDLPGWLKPRDDRLVAG